MDFKWELADRLVADPMSMKLTELKDVARPLGVKMTGTKAVLSMRLLHAFGVEQPVHVPAKVLWYIAAEKSRTVPWDLLHSAQILGLLTPLPAQDGSIPPQAASSWFSIRQLLADRYKSEAALKHDTAVADKLEAEKRAAEAERYRQEWVQRQARQREHQMQQQALARERAQQRQLQNQVRQVGFE